MIDKAVMALPGVKKRLGLLAGLSALRAALIVFSSWCLARAITWLWEGGALGGALWWAALFLLCFAARQGTLFVQDKLLFAYAAKQAGGLRQKLLQKIFTLGPQLVQKHGTGNMATMALEGMQQVESYIRLILAKLAAMALVPLAVLGSIFALDWVSGLILLGVFPLILLFMVLLGQAARSRAQRQYGSFQRLSNHFVDSLRGIGTLKRFGLSGQYAASIFSVSEHFRKATMQTLRMAILSSFALDFFCTLSVAVVAVGLGLRLLSGAMLLLPALAVLILSPEYFLPIRDFAGDYHATLDGKNALAAVLAVLQEAEPATQELPLAPWQAHSTLELRGLSFSYPDFTAIQGLSLKAQGFQKIGVIGTSGAGKSTLINLLGGFAAPQEGQIHICGQAAPSLQLAGWQKQVLYIPQNPYIFHASLRQNIAFYYPKASKEEIIHAVEVVGLQTLVDELPEGLDTPIGEGARPLSGGQAQRIALARALLDKSRNILLFDEPTAHLDIETEVELKEKMLPLMEGRLVFFATHRLHWMQDMDMVLVLENGRIAEAGPPGALLAQNGAFAHLAHQIQKGGPGDCE